jgi:hypothetical protein
MKILRVAAPVLVAILGLAFAPLTIHAQGSTGSGSGATAAPSSSTPAHVQPGQKASTGYQKPSTAVKLHNYLFDAFGPYSIATAALAGGINQASNTPPEWGQGMQGYGQRVASNYGIEIVTHTARYALAEAFREDTIYYRCDCSGIFPRSMHALISTVTARRGDDGHRVFSFPDLAAPYAGGMTAALGWYPARYSASDGFRMGNYNLLTQAGQNLALEFLYGGPHTLLPHFHTKQQ